MSVSPEPIYCGAGIKCPEDAAKVKAAGGNGFFVGSSIIKLYEKPEEQNVTLFLPTYFIPLQNGFVSLS